jgi:capsular polysaccharide biosynthesis protein
MVIGVHGAGLSNVVWSEPGTKVLELRSPVHANECFSTIADHCGLDYATEVLALAHGSESGDRFANLVVEPASVERVIRGWVG